MLPQYSYLSREIFRDFIPGEEKFTCYKTEQNIDNTLPEEPLAIEIAVDGFYL